MSIKTELHKEEIRSLIEKHLPTGSIWDDISDLVMMKVEKNDWGDESIVITVSSTPQIDSVNEVLLTFSGN